MEGDKAHFSEVYTALDLFYQLVAYFTVRHVSPPDQDIGVFQHLIRQTLVGIVESGKRHLHILVFVKKTFDYGVQTVGINCFYRVLGLFVAELVPDYNVQSFHMQSHFPVFYF